MSDWAFDEARDTACFTSTFVLAGSPVLRVYHNYDGDWQFHGKMNQPSTAEVARVVSLGAIVEMDHSISELHDLPYGWCAIRETETDTWVRSKNHPFPTYQEHGYYLEDAVEMSHQFHDISPPPDDVRESVPVGTYVKLLFRFAAEGEDRSDYEVERMWVLVTDVDEDDGYCGTLENEPHHEGIIDHGELLRFHSTHIIEIL